VTTQKVVVIVILTNLAMSLLFGTVAVVVQRSST
jgi:hypothetical protein